MLNSAAANSLELSDADLIARVLHGETALYGIIVKRYNARLYRAGMSILDNEDDVQDAMQQAYLNAYENLEKFLFKSTFSTWLTRIMINQSLQMRSKRQRSLALNSEIMDHTQHPGQASESSQVDSQKMNAHLRDALEGAIRQLPEKYRTVFMLREIEKMNVAETSACLNISVINVKVRLNRAKSRLKDTLLSNYNREELFHFHLKYCDKMVERVLSKIQPK
jgi:RNA polymerase sigma-70 factor (ECF subfamily)